MDRAFDIWSEGFRVTGQSGTAVLHARGVRADSFLGACAKFAARNADFRAYFSVYGPKAYYWGCRLYDNESDARRSFG